MLHPSSLLNRLRIKNRSFTSFILSVVFPSRIMPFIVIVGEKLSLFTGDTLLPPKIANMECRYSGILAKTPAAIQQDVAPRISGAVDLCVFVPPVVTAIQTNKENPIEVLKEMIHELRFLLSEEIPMLVFDLQRTCSTSPHRAKWIKQWADFIAKEQNCFFCSPTFAFPKATPSHSHTGYMTFPKGMTTKVMYKLVHQLRHLLKGKRDKNLEARVKEILAITQDLPPFLSPVKSTPSPIKRRRSPSSSPEQEAKYQLRSVVVVPPKKKLKF